MSALIFQNQGLLDLNALRIMGVSVKDTSSPIGMFGTGLKYASASALRLGGSLTIYVGLERYDLSSREITIREKPFSQVLLNGEPMGFTSDLGKKWEPWMVVRELFSNAKDEGGDTQLVDEDTFQPSEGRTAIILRGEKFVEVWNNRHLYFIQGDESPMFNSAYCEVYHNNRPGKPTVFYKGIRIHEADAPMMFTYNLKGNIELTEDRTLKWNHQLRDRVCSAVAIMEDESLIERFLTAPELVWESVLDFDISTRPSATFNKVCAHLMRQRPKDLNQKAIAYYRRQTGDKPDLTDIEPTAVQKKMIARATDFLRGLGYSPELDAMPIRTVAWLGEGIMGQAKNNTIILAKPVFDQGTKYIASTILEELVHNRTGYGDATLELQTWLFDRIISMGEEMSGEPL